VNHDEAVTLGLNVAGGIGVSASVTLALIAFDSGEAADLLPAFRLFSIGLVSLLAARPEKKALRAKK
jgi:hypothetical protein